LLIINPNTVARAYRELEREGFIYTRKGKGCFVTDDSRALIKKERTVILNQVFDEAIQEAKKLNLSPGEIKKIFERRLSLKTEGRKRGEK
jgi:GntR family transcriptional regulator